MYVGFFNLREQPFNLTPDPRFLFPSPQHEEALSHLLYGIYERKGFIEITGEVGTGKTILCRALLERLDDTVSTALIFNSYLNEMELLQAILHDLGLSCKENTRKACIDTLNRYLLQEFAAGRNAVVLVDEAQNLDSTVLEQLRMLSNLETDDGKLLQVVLVGQPELRQRLSLPQMRQLEQRIAVRFHLRNLSRAETRQYVMHRLSVAGAANSVTFTPRAWRHIHQYCAGIPRRINLLCDRILMTAYVRGTHRITARVVRLSRRDLSGPRRFAAGQRLRFSPLLALGVLLSLGMLGFLTGAFLLPAAQSRPESFLAARLRTFAQYLTAMPAAPLPAVEPPAPVPAAVPAPTPTSPLSMQVNLPLAQTLWQIKTQAEALLPPSAATPPAEREAAVLRTANAMGFDSIAIHLEVSRVSLFSRPCLLEIALEPTVVQLWVLARGLDDGVLLYEPNGLTRIPLQQLQEIEYGKIYLVRERGQYYGPTLRPGMQGARIHALQQVLQALGHFTGAVSGVFDEQTLQAVKDFQQDNQLAVDGQVGRQTLLLLLYLDARILTDTT